MSHDVIIIGGSYAGLAAALQLGRARRRVLVVDAGQRRNRFAAHSHGFLGHDGRGAAELAALGRAEVAAYPTVAWRDGVVVDARTVAAREAPGADAAPREAAGHEPRFEVVLDDGARFTARRLILAGGVVDELPPIPGLAERWGRHVFHCPYCHGYELDGGPMGVIAATPMATHVAQLLPDWGPTTLFVQGFEPDADTLAALARRGVTLERTAVEGIEGAADVRLADGRVLRFAGIFLATRTRLANDLPVRLGCALEDGPIGRFIQTDPMRETTVRGVFACGDAATAAGSVTFAVAEGVRAGIAAHRSLIFTH